MATTPRRRLMEKFDRKKHWEKVYKTKRLEEVSWFQSMPETSLNFFEQFKVERNAKIIDIGGGDSLLVDHLLDLGYDDITILDISPSAIDRAKQRLGDRADKVKWIVSDVTVYSPEEKYDFWHDRAAFHFLTDENEIAHYLETAQQSIQPSGVLVLGTFSDKGPDKCSGLATKRYSEFDMTERLKKFFEKIRCIAVDHRTPLNKIQNFIFCSFRKIHVG